MTLDEFFAEAKRIGLTAEVFAAHLAERPEFADCLPLASHTGEAEPSQIYWHNPQNGQVWSDTDVRFHCKDTTGWSRVVIPSTPPAVIPRVTAAMVEQQRQIAADAESIGKNLDAIRGQLAATPVALGEVTDEQIRASAYEHCFKASEMATQGEQLYMFDLARIKRLCAALSHPAPMAAPASVPQAIDQLVSALAESKGWMRDYARALIEDAIDRRHLEVAAPAPASEAVAWRYRLKGFPWQYQDIPFFAGGTPGPREEHQALTLDDLLAILSAGDSVDAPVKQAALTDAARAVLAERQRQISAEGWTPEHDDEHDSGSMAIAAACYAIADRKDVQVQTLNIRMLWRWTGWADLWFKPKDRRHNLVRAGALIIAEVERIDRAALKGEQPAEPSGSERGEV